jgi:hypothetical protein
VVCGVNGQLSGVLSDPNGEMLGFDADFARWLRRSGDATTGEFAR